ncbi:MAG: SRPBCC domain-containing protein [Bacteroidetes bacterium]|nr:SRPBCC domain-containing protein [Bacteroidota bacterium]
MKNKTKNQNYTATILVDSAQQDVYKAINNVRGWWSENIRGKTDKLNAVWRYQYKDVHLCKIKIIELVPNKKVVWHVLENYFNFTTDENEWKGNKIIFEISRKGKKTQLLFTHDGLVPDYECYSICNDAWTSYIKGSLKNLITKGKGNPNTKEKGLNTELIEKWKLSNIEK